MTNSRRKKKEHVVEEINKKISTVKNIDKPLYFNGSSDYTVKTTETFSINYPPPIVGRWKINSFTVGCGATYFYVSKKPKWITRFFMKHIFDCVWENETL